MTKTYSAKDIQVLGEIEHIRLNSGMYIGETSTPTHLIEESLDNALDEALAGFAKIIAVIIDTKENKFTILDDGRGIPIEDNTPVIISTKLFSGGKFQDRKSAYEISSGLHGVGLVAVNALSSEYKIEVCRDNKFATYNFKDAKLKNKKIIKHEGPKPFATKIEFVPDKKFFETLTPNLARIRQRLTAASAEMPDDISFVLYIDDKKEIFKLTALEYFKENCLADQSEDEIYPIEVQKGSEKFNVLFTYEQNGKVALKHTSSVNLLPVTDGGVHLNCFLDQIKEFFRLKAKKHGFTFQPQDVLIGLRIYMSLSLREPKFSGQTKDRLINIKTDIESFTTHMKPQLEKIFEIDDRLDVLLNRFQDYRNKLDSRKLIKIGSGGKRASTKFTKLRDCTNRNGELYIVEGDSAGGCGLGSTKIKLTDGRNISMIDLVTEDIKGKVNFIYARDNNTNSVVTHQLINPIKTRINAELYKIIFGNGKYEIFTPDHLFMLKDGTYVELQNLKVGDSLMTLSGINCRVVSVEKLDYRDDVYDFEVPHYHNFALSSGIFVHNSIIQSRDTRKHAVLPLRGKSIPNATTKKNILENKEVKELIMAIGAGFGPHFDITKVRYSKIICATDADFDGSHIACLVSMAMAILLPEVVQSNLYFIAQTPLYAIKEKKLFKPLWSEDELNKARDADRTIQRYKGLGEMNPGQLKICLLDEETRHLTPVTYSGNIDGLIKLFSSAEEKRKLVGG